MDKYKHKQTGEIIEAVCIDEAFLNAEVYSRPWMTEANKKFKPFRVNSDSGAKVAMTILGEFTLGAMYFALVLSGKHTGDIMGISKEHLALNWDKIDEAIAKDEPVIQEAAEVRTYQAVGFPNIIREAVCINESFFRRLNTGYYPEWVESFSDKAKMMFNSQNGTFIANGNVYQLGEQTLMRLHNNEEHADIVHDGFYRLHKEIGNDKPYCADQIEKIISNDPLNMKPDFWREVPMRFRKDQKQGIKANEIASKIADTMNQRAQDRGEKEERSMARTVAMFNALKGQTVMSEHDGWRFMELLKMVRSEVGSKFVLDDYIDGGAYCFLAGECRSQQQTTEQQ